MDPIKSLPLRFMIMSIAALLLMFAFPYIDVLLNWLAVKKSREVVFYVFLGIACLLIVMFTKERMFYG